MITIIKFALAIPCKDTRRRFMMEVGKQGRGARLFDTWSISDLKAALNNVN